MNLTETCVILTGGASALDAWHVT